MKTLLSVVILTVGCSSQAGTPVSPQAPPTEAISLEDLIQRHAAGLRAHLEFLADDLLEGRGTGDRGYDIAARYAISELIAAGAEPAGDAGQYLQAVPLRESKIAKASLVVHADGKPRELKWVDEFIASPSHLEARQNIRAAAVFAGFGIVSAELGIDDYKGLDVRGKIVVLLLGGHSQLPSEPRAHHSSRTEKLKTAVGLGAVGVIFVHSLQMDRRFPWEKLKHFAEKPAMTWLDANVKPFVVPAGSGPVGAVSPAVAAELFSAAGKSFETIRLDADAKPARVSGFELPIEFEIVIESSHRNIKSANVAAMLPGTDPSLRDQVVVVSAHLDHLGIGEPKNGDAINNGALDNASGSAMVLELASVMKTNRPKRSVLFLLVTAEEKGLIGSDFFARNPPSSSAKMVANINLDLVFWETGTKKVVFYGEGNSSLGPLAAELATKAGYEVIADPFPEKGYFTRSDHYSFVKQGVPALFLGTGFDNDGAAAVSYTKNHYHQVSDELGPIVVDYREGAKLVLLMADLLAAIGNAEGTPSWTPGNFFTKLYGSANR